MILPDSVSEQLSSTSFAPKRQEEDETGLMSSYRIPGGLLRFKKGSTAALRS